jgi:hypothetical protein
LISQRGNRLANKTARHIRVIAEASHVENAAMRSIAEDSRSVALSARRDGADMRVIAVVTLLFLPGTFVAVCSKKNTLRVHTGTNLGQTIFSTSFFDFSPGSNDTKRPFVSNQVWIYAVITITLTVLVVGAWYILAHRKHKHFHGTKHRELDPIDLEKQTKIRNLFDNARLSSVDQLDDSPSTSLDDSLGAEKGSDRIERYQRRDGLPASKVMMKGMTDVEKTCACCARSI